MISLTLVKTLLRAGFTSIAETDGLSTFGRAEPMVKGDSILSLERSSLANSKMGGDMATFFVSKLMVQGMLFDFMFFSPLIFER